MKTKAYICDCCGYADFGAPYAHKFAVTMYANGNRQDYEFPDVCEGCVILLSRCIELAFKNIRIERDRETLQ